jgi:hypothetical protein
MEILFKPIEKALFRPLTVEQVKQRVDEHNHIEGIVRIDLTDVVYDTEESFLDRLSKALVGDTTLTCISQVVVGELDGFILVKVGGDASARLRR